MITDIDQVRVKPREIILKGYNPYYDYESACDHMIDWTVLTKEEFTIISDKSKKGKRAKISTDEINALYLQSTGSQELVYGISVRICRIG